MRPTATTLDSTSPVADSTCFNSRTFAARSGESPFGAVSTWSATRPERTWSVDSRRAVVWVKTTVDAKETARTSGVIAPARRPASARVLAAAR